jgi:hypothetical protein
MRNDLNRLIYFVLFFSYAFTSLAAEVYWQFVEKQQAVASFDDDSPLNALATELTNLVVSGEQDLVFTFPTGIENLPISFNKLLPSESQRRDFLTSYALFVKLNSRQPEVIKPIDQDTSEDILKNLPLKSDNDIKKLITELGETPEIILVNRTTNNLVPPANNALTWHIDCDEEEPLAIVFCSDSRLVTEYITHPVPMIVINSAGAEELLKIIQQNPKIISSSPAAHGVVHNKLKQILETKSDEHLKRRLQYSHTDHVFINIYPHMSLESSNLAINTFITFPADLVHRTPQKRELPGVDHRRVLAFVTNKKN